jgi:hypothetical protein
MSLGRHSSRILASAHLFDTLEHDRTSAPRQREPRSLLPEQMGQWTACTLAVPQRVRAWVLWEDGIE